MIRDQNKDSPITHLNTTLETIIEMPLSSSSSKDLSLDNESINTEIPCYFFCFICRECGEGFWGLDTVLLLASLFLLLLPPLLLPLPLIVHPRTQPQLRSLSCSSGDTYRVQKLNRLVFVNRQTPFLLLSGE
jgi:hypothetical protein